MSKAAKRKSAIVGSVSIEWTTVDVGSEAWWYLTILSPTSVNSGFEHLNIILLAPTPCKPVFKGEFYLRVHIIRSL